jgi:hypothetical protein
MTLDGCFSSPTTNHVVVSKVLDKKTIEAASARLYGGGAKKHLELPPINERRVISQEDMGKSLDRLYNNHIANKRKMMEDLDKKQHPDQCKHVVLDRDVLETAFLRMYSGAMDHHKEGMSKLRAKYLSQSPKTKRLPKEAVTESADRLCKGAIEKTQENMAKLHQKYVLEVSPVFPKLTKEQMKVCADRLCTKK